jgi:hypothetical protein
MEAVCPAAKWARQRKSQRKKRRKTEAEVRFIMGLLTGRIPQP